jgi:hypothetical protein
LKLKYASKDILEFAEAKNLSFSTFSSPWKRMSSINTLSLRIPVWYQTLISLDLSLTSLVGIIQKRKKLLTCTHETARVKLE